jgi:hypothetical protein
MSTSSSYKSQIETVSMAADKTFPYGEGAKEMPEALAHIQKSIDNSVFITSLSADWDDAGSLSVSSDLYQSAVTFLKKYALFVYKILEEIIPEPDIAPVKDGTIDLEWHTPKARMLINIKGDGTASYYGDNLSNLNSIKGRVATEEVEFFLASWMTKLSN